MSVFARVLSAIREFSCVCSIAGMIFVGCSFLYICFADHAGIIARSFDSWQEFYRVQKPSAQVDLGTISAKNCKKSYSCLIARPFDSWQEFYREQKPGSQREFVMPCVKNEKKWYNCLPSLIVVGTFKGGTTGLRAKLAASGNLWTLGKKGEPEEAHFWDRIHPHELLNRTVPEVADLYARKVGHTSRKFADIADATTKIVKKVAFDTTPRYMISMSLNMLRLMHKVLPNAQLLLLARPGADVYFSGMQMNTCINPCNKSKLLSLISAEREGGCKLAQKKAAKWAIDMLKNGRKRHAEILHDPNVQIDRVHHMGTYFHGSYALPLAHLLRVWPQSQATVIESGELWRDPSQVYDRIAKEAHFPFHINLAKKTRKRPVLQDSCVCSRSSELEKLVHRCELKVPFRCTFYGANERFADLLNKSWPRSWNIGLNLTQCLRLGFEKGDFFEPWPSFETLDQLQAASLGAVALGDT